MLESVRSQLTNSILERLRRKGMPTASGLTAESSPVSPEAMAPGQYSDQTNMPMGDSLQAANSIAPAPISAPGAGPLAQLRKKKPLASQLGAAEEV